MNELARLEDQLLDIEARVGLLEACRPLGMAGEEARLTALLAARAPDPDELAPRVTFPPRAPLELERIRLEQTEQALYRLASASGETREVARILAERAWELGLDIELVQARGTSRMVTVARTRFVGAERSGREEADRLAQAWIQGGLSAVPVAEDERIPLGAELVRLARSAGLDVLVHEVEMVARAAVTQRALLVRRGALVTVAQAARIFTHEVCGHFLPRRAALACGPPFRIGPRGADADEEGRALQLELWSGQFDAERSLELGVRHVLAAHVLDGGSIGEALLALRDRGVPAPVLARIGPRVVRGGGLCREIIYLPALVRVGPHLADPEVERVFRSGRVTLAEVDFLRRLLPEAQGVHSSSAMTGA